MSRKKEIDRSQLRSVCFDRRREMPEREVRLPLELWRLILSYLDVLDLCRCAQVGQEWRELVKSLDSTRWKELFLSSKKWKHPNWPNYPHREPVSWKDTYKRHHLAAREWVNRSMEVRCAPFLHVFRRRLERRVKHVGGSQDFSTLKSAIAAASPFDCIILHRGIYDDQRVLSLKFPVEICGQGELGNVVLQMPIEQQASTSRIHNLVLQPGLLRAQTSLPVIVKVGTGHMQLDNCILEQGHIQVSSPGSVVIRYCTFFNSFITLRSACFSRVDNCEFRSGETSYIVIEGMPPVTRQRPISRPVEGWLSANGMRSLGLEKLYDLSLAADVNTRGNVKTADHCPQTIPTSPSEKKSCHMKNSSSVVTMVTNDLSHSTAHLSENLNTKQRARFPLDVQCREVIRSIHGCIISGNRFSSGKGGLLVRRRGHVWFEGNELFNLVHGIRCLTGAKVVSLNNTIHDCETSGIFFREKSSGLAAGNFIYSNKEAGVDIRSMSDPILQHNHIHSGKRSGIVVLDRGRGLIRDNDIYDNREAGVYILYRGNPIVKHNRIWSGRAAGVAVTEEGRGQICHNDIRGMGWGGVDIRNGGNPLVSNNCIRDGHADGIVIGEGGKGVILDNDIRGNSGCGVWVLTISKPVIYGNRIGDCGDSGIAFVGNSDLHHDNQQLSLEFIQQDQDQEQHLQPLFFDEDLSSASNLEDHDPPFVHSGPRPNKNYASVDNNSIFNNAGHGIHFCSNEGLLIRSNSIHGNKACGINITKPAEIIIQDNSICSNEGSGVNIEMGCSASIHGNGIYSNCKYGVLVTGRGLIKENDVFCNEFSSFEIYGPGDPQISGNRVLCMKHHGVRIMENGRGFLEGNVIYDSGAGGLYQHPDSTATVNNNQIVPVNIHDGRQGVCIYNEDTKQCHHKDTLGLMLDSPPLRPSIPDKDNKSRKPLGPQQSSASSGAANIVTSITSCHGRSRLCVIL